MMGVADEIGTYRVECQKTPKLDQAMEVSKCDVDWDEHDIGRVPEKVTPELDGFAENKCPYREADEETVSLVDRPRFGRFVPGVENEAVVGKCPGGDGRLKYRVRAPWLSPVVAINI